MEIRRPTPEHLRVQAERWIEAAKIARAEDYPAFGHLLMPWCGSKEASYAEIVQMCVLGSVMVADAMARLHGHTLADECEVELFVVPSNAEPPAVSRLAIGMVCNAARRAVDVRALQSWATPDEGGLDRTVELLYELMGMYLSVTGEPEVIE